MAISEAEGEDDLSENSLGWPIFRDSSDETEESDAYELDGRHRNNVNAEAVNVGSESDAAVEEVQLLDAENIGVKHPAKSGFTENRKPTAAEEALIAGSTFKEWADFDYAFDEYEGKGGWRLLRLSWNKSRLYARCRGYDKEDEGSCQAMLSVRRLGKSGVISIRKSWLIHSCPVNLHQFRSGASRSRWVSTKLLPQVMVNHDSSVKQLRESLLRFHSTDSKQWSLQRARRICRKKAGGGGGQSFGKIPAYCELVKKEDGDAHVHWEADEEGNFLRMYMAPSASKHDFNYCRPFVGLDGTHTVGEFPMIILLATCYDGENHVLMLAWAMVHKENHNNWAWFLTHLKVSFPKMCRSDTVFVSDRDKGLIGGVKDVFGDAHHSFCTQHIKGNIQSFSDASCGSFFVKVARASTKEEFDKLLSNFVPKSERQKGVVPYIQNIDPRLYSRHAFPSPRWGHTTSNVVEVVNHAIKQIRKLPALHVCDSLWTYNMVKHCERAQHARALPQGMGTLTQFANNMYCDVYGESQSVVQQPSSDSQALMIDRHGSWALKVHEEHCDCGNWKEMTFPCPHALRFEGERGRDAKNFIGSFWTATYLRHTYNVPLPPISIDRLEWSDICKEPILHIPRKKQRKVKRRRSKWESQMAEHERLVFLKKQKCSNCLRQGHNKRGCLLPRQDPSLLAFGEHDKLRVMAVHSLSRSDVEQAWQVYNTRPSTQCFADWYMESQVDGAGPSQVTQA